ncbi:MAG TPA: 16S rRNA (cytidine(1402)-2'-O)-methyltransferase [Patescibacteria group bacterium]|nr:16S rRNA (cytidine(1402)-2'-O)-methyltransferase [Patescibacteria group bacterium]
MPRKTESDLAGGLYIVATPIGNMGDITARAVEILGKVDVIACEDTREAGKLTSYHGLSTDKIPYHDHNADEMRPKLLRMLQEGSRIALISDAGMPLISDPGYKLVHEAVAAGIYVTCAPGASATLTALVLSGLPSDRFMFAGFLPPKSAARKSALGEVKPAPCTLIFYETAPRLAESLADMAEIFGNRQAAVARELTKKFEEVRRGPLAELAAHYEAEGPPKGEIVIVVGAPGADDAAAWTDEKIDALLLKMMDAEGMGVKDAAGFVAAQSGRKKGDLYQRALLLKGKR